MSEITFDNRNDFIPELVSNTPIDGVPMYVTYKSW